MLLHRVCGVLGRGGEEQDRDRRMHNDLKEREERAMRDASMTDEEEQEEETYALN